MNPSSTSPPVLTGHGIVLRPPKDGDVETRLAFGRDAEIHRMYGGSAASAPPYRRADARGWVNSIAEHPAAWIIDHNGAIGEVRLDNINRSDRRASLAIGIFDPQRLGRGLGTAATKLVLAHAFGALGLHRVSLRVLDFNERAIASYRKCGFSIEGREREAALIDGQWHDDIMMGILAREFSAQSDLLQGK